MKILHTADWHLGDRLGRIDRTADLRHAVERIATYCEQEKVDVLLVAGDLFSELSRPEGLRESVEHLQQVFLPFLLRKGTIVALTGNHDNENFCQTLRNAMALAAPEEPELGGQVPPGRLYLAPHPTFLRVPDKEGNEVQFILMPYPTPSRYLREEETQRYGSLEEKNRHLEAAFTRKLREIQNHPCFDPCAPAVLAAHIHVRGVVLPSLFRMSEQESIVFGDADLPTELAYIGLGHIHQPQGLNGLDHVRYCGSIERLDLGERFDQKSVTVVDIGPQGRRGDPYCLPLDATPMYDLSIHNPREELPTLRDRFPDAERALVRFHVRYQAGTDNLNAVLEELDRIFPRWYQRDWSEASDLRAALTGSAAAPAKSFHDTVCDYLKTELMDHPDADRDEVLRLAEALLAEEGA